MAGMTFAVVGDPQNGGMEMLLQQGSNAVGAGAHASRMDGRGANRKSSLCKRIDP
jgi:hypothetical protein